MDNAVDTVNEKAIQFEVTKNKTGCPLNLNFSQAINNF